MAIPASTTVFAQSLDPYDIDHFTMKTLPALDPGEDVASWNVELLAEALLMGLKLGEGAYRPYLLNKEITIWLMIEEDMQQAAIFDNGQTLPLRLSITTTGTPPRKKQQTFAVRVVQK